MTAEVLLHFECSESVITCQICMDTFVSPRILPCQHTFCKQCVVSLISKHCLDKDGNTKRAYFPCPNCRRDCKIRQKGKSTIDEHVKCFPENLLMKTVMDSLTEQCSFGGLTTSSNSDTENVITNLRQKDCEVQTVCLTKKDCKVQTSYLTKSRQVQTTNVTKTHRQVQTENTSRCNEESISIPPSAARSMCMFLWRYRQVLETVLQTLRQIDASSGSLEGVSRELFSIFMERVIFIPGVTDARLAESRNIADDLAFQLNHNLDMEKQYDSAYILLLAQQAYALKDVARKTEPHSSGRFHMFLILLVAIVGIIVFVMINTTHLS